MAGIGNFPYFVHYVLDDGPNIGECRPATVVRDWGGYQNLVLFADGENDRAADTLTWWHTSTTHSPDGARGTWHHARECADIAPARGAEPAPADVAPLTTAEWNTLGAQPTEGEGA